MQRSMTDMYDPNIADYADESAVRREFARSLDVCAGCRRCEHFCPSFEGAFVALRAVGGRADQMTPHLQDQIVDACYGCGLCAHGCPHSPKEIPGVDIPALMIRHRVMLRTVGLLGIRRRAARMVEDGGSQVLRWADRLSGGVRNRVLPTSISEWFDGRPRVRSMKSQGEVALFVSCSGAFRAGREDLAAGIAAVKVLEHNGVHCSLVDGGTSCGEDALRHGDLGRFTKLAIKNIRDLAREVRLGREIIVLSPRCRDVIVCRYVQLVGGPDATLVAAHTKGIAEYLVSLLDDPKKVLDLEFTGPRPDSVVYSASCPTVSSRECADSEMLLRLLGTSVRRNDRCCGGGQCRDFVEIHGVSAHPVEIMARAYGMEP